MEDSMLEINTKCRCCHCERPINFNVEQDDICPKCKFCGQKEATYSEYVQGLICETCRKEVINGSTR